MSEDQVQPTGVYYPEDGQYYPDYGYPASQGYPQELDRQGIETALATPLVITAFLAAIVGGIMGPLISGGLSRLGEYQIEWPQVRRKTTPVEVEDRAWGQHRVKVGSVFLRVSDIALLLFQRSDAARYSKYLDR